MGSMVLFIFEGEQAEVNITDNLRRYFVNEPDKTLVKASYCHNIYQLYKDMTKESFLDITGLIIEVLEARDNRGDKLTDSEHELLALEDRDVISDVYLFFDYDQHCSNANDQKLEAQLDYFSSAQEEGLLCVSYPMVEAIKQIKPQQKYTPVTTELLPLQQFKNYKKWLNAQIKQGVFCDRYKNWGKYSVEDWREIISLTIQRANLLIHNTASLEFKPIEQSHIFAQQQKKHIPNGVIAVLSAFPLMLLDYYGVDLAKKLHITYLFNDNTQ